MPEARMAFPDLRHPFDEKPINAAGGAIILYAGRTIEISRVLKGDGLWISAADLTRVNGFELKPEGACFESLCFPLKDALLKEQAGQQWIDLAAFADLLGQPYISDEETQTWSFGEIPAKRDDMMSNAMAPDFEVLDREGNVIRMADFKGKKALIVTWSSW